jgi:hypothetical protein
MCNGETRARRRKTVQNAIDSTIAATDWAIRQVMHSVVLAESGRTCVPPRKSNDWKPQKWAACAKVAISSKATLK